MTVVETNWQAIIPNLATHADIAELNASLKTWMVGTMIAMMVCFGGLFLAMSTFIVNTIKLNAPVNALPVQAVQAQPQPPPPIVINNIMPSGVPASGSR